MVVLHWGWGELIKKKGRQTHIHRQMKGYAETGECTHTITSTDRYEEKDMQRQVNSPRHTNTEKKNRETDVHMHIQTSSADTGGLYVAACLGLSVQLAGNAPATERAKDNVLAAVTLDVVALADDVAGLRWS
jgi:hypothetical protein